ncbi:hypothetical protein C8F01DRAFT_1089320 [Mycena amicta]|nr:hypothetical protein C8F01DRAFT_1089320 [Mycena amicta]
MSSSKTLPDAFRRGHASRRVENMLFVGIYRNAALPLSCEPPSSLIFFRSCLVRLSRSTKAARRLVSTRVPRILKVVLGPVQLLTSSSTRSPSDPTSPTVIPGTPSLRSGMYQLPPVSLALFCAFSLIGIILVCLTLRRLGFAEKAATVFETNVKKIVGTLCIVLASVTHCLVQMSVIAVYRFGMANEDRIKDLVLLLSTSTIRTPPSSVLPPTATYPLLLPSTSCIGSGIYQQPPASLILCFLAVLMSVTFVCLALRRLGFAEKAATPFKTMVRKTVGTLCILVDQMRDFVTHCIVQLSIFHQLGMVLEYESKIKELATDADPAQVLLVASLHRPSNIWRINRNTLRRFGKIFINPTLKALKREDLLTLVAFLTALGTYDISTLAIIQRHIATHRRWSQHTGAGRNTPALVATHRRWSQHTGAGRNTPALVAPLASRPGTNSPQMLLFYYRNSVFLGRAASRRPSRRQRTMGLFALEGPQGLDLPPTFDYRRLKWLQDLGQGAYGEVAKALTDTGLHIAVKKINRGPWLPRRLRRGAAGKLCMIERATILDNLLAEIPGSSRYGGTPNIIALHGVWHDAENFYVGMELGKQCLADMVMTRQCVYVFGRQLYQINAVKALHENGIVHLDIKPDKVLANGFELKHLCSPLFTVHYR